MKPTFRLFASLLLAAATSVASAQSTRLDDTGTQVMASTLRLKWDDALPGATPVQTLSGTVTVMVRLDTRPWRGRGARIYQVLPAQPGGRVFAQWTSQGSLLPGQLRDGERALVYAGAVEFDELRDTLRLTITADGAGLEGAQALGFGFEIEPEGP